MTKAVIDKDIDDVYKSLQKGSQELLGAFGDYKGEG